MSTVNQRSAAAAPKLVAVAEKRVSDKTPGIQIPWRKVAIYVVLALGFSLLGAVPMWLRAIQNADEREAAQHELRLSQMENQLAASVIDARRGEYEPARQKASDFFTALRSQIDRGPDSDLSEGQRSNLKVLLNQRDDVITLLARNDPAAADRLSNIYVDYRTTMREMSALLNPA